MVAPPTGDSHQEKTMYREVLRSGFEEIEPSQWWAKDDDL